MALPMNSTPTYSVEIPSTGEKVGFRPFLVREEKALLIAQQSEDTEVMVQTLKDVIASCVNTQGFDVDKIALFDLEYLFTMIRAKSVGEEVELIFGCEQDACVENEKARVKLKIDLNTVGVKTDPEHSKKIALFDDVGVVMKYPDFSLIKQLDGVLDGNLDKMFDLVIECIDYIYNSEEVYYAKETSREELHEFLYNLSTDQFKGIQTFFETMPKLHTEVEYDCPICGTHYKRDIEGLSNFF